MPIAVFDYSTLEIGISIHDFGFSPHFTRCTRRRDSMCLPFRRRLLRARPQRAHIGDGRTIGDQSYFYRITRSSCYQWNCCARWPERQVCRNKPTRPIWQSVVCCVVGAAIFIQILSHFTAHCPDRTAYFVGSAVHAVHTHLRTHVCFALSHRQMGKIWPLPLPAHIAVMCTEHGMPIHAVAYYICAFAAETMRSKVT